MNKRSLRFLNWPAAGIIFGLMPLGNFAQTTSQTTTSVTNSPPRAARLENLPSNTNLPSLFLIGDSTVRNGQGRGDGGLAKHPGNRRAHEDGLVEHQAEIERGR